MKSTLVAPPRNTAAALLPPPYAAMSFALRSMLDDAWRSLIAVPLSPWIAAFGGADADFEYAVLANLLFLTALRQLVVVLSSYGTSRLSRELAKRPTVVPVLLHSFVTTAFAAAVIFPPGRPSLDEQPLTIWLWRRWGLPFSMGYWLFDLYFYCWKKSDALIAAHHALIFLANYPIGDDAGLRELERLSGTCNYVMISTNGYVLEATTFLLYTRWALIHTLERHSAVYTANNAALLVSWVALRILYAPYVWWAHVWPSCPVTSSDVWSTALVAHAAYLLIVSTSCLWLAQMLLPDGLRAFLVLRKSLPSSVAAPTFGAKVD